MMGSLEKLDNILFQEKVVDECLSVSTALKSFKVVTEKCFGMELVEGYGAAIHQFSIAFRQLEKDPPLKVHILEGHVMQLLELQKAKFPGKGLGFFHEQASESVYHDWHELWVGSISIKESLEIKVMTVS